MIGVTDEAVISGFGTVVAAIIALAVLASRLRERISRIEEWIRLHERREQRPPVE